MRHKTTQIMKKLLFITALGLSFSACNPVAYQVIETKMITSQSQTELPTFENSEIKVDYNFLGGDNEMYYRLYNKGTEPIFIDLDRSHLIVNGQSFDYYQDSEQIKTIKTASTNFFNYAANTSQFESTVRSKMKKTMQIPPKSFIVVSGPQIVSGRIFDCDLRKVKSKPVTKEYTQDNTPLVFRNFLTYSFSKDFKSDKSIDNAFYAEKISVMGPSAFNGKFIKLKNCPTDKLTIQRKEMPYSKPQNMVVKFMAK